jgi:hypothetical protein
LDTLVALQVQEAPEHAVLPNASKYDLRRLRFVWAEGEVPAVLEIELSTHTDYAVLRFEGVEQLYVGSGDIPSSIRLQIQDTSQCPSATHYIPPVRVGGVTPCGLQFWAQNVRRFPNGPADS